MLPFYRKRLTHELENEIRDYVKKKNPTGYFLFSSTYITTNLLSIAAVSEIFGYFMFSILFHYANLMVIPEFELFLNSFIQLVIGTFCLLVVLSILNDKFYKDIQALAREGARNIA